MHMSDNYLCTNPFRLQENLVYAPVTIQLNSMSAYYMGTGGVLYDVSGPKRKKKPSSLGTRPTNQSLACIPTDMCVIQNASLLLES